MSPYWEILRKDCLLIDNPSNLRLDDTLVLFPLWLSNIALFEGGPPNLSTSTSLDTRLLLPQILVGCNPDRRTQITLPLGKPLWLSTVSCPPVRQSSPLSSNRANSPVGSASTIQFYPILFQQENPVNHGEDAPLHHILHLYWINSTSNSSH